MNPTTLLNNTFTYTDKQLAERKCNSGCTAVVSFIQTEKRNVDKRVLYTANVGDARAILWYLTLN